MGISADNKALARYLRSVLGGSPTVARYWDDAKTSSVDLLIECCVPTDAVNTLATLGLSDFSINTYADGVPLRVEFLIAAKDCFDFTANILATCAFNVINTKMECKPGSICPHVVEMYHPTCDMKHILFVPPFLWNMEAQMFPTKTVAWLQAIPISERECVFARTRGSDALEKLFEERQIDVFNLDRTSIL